MVTEDISIEFLSLFLAYLNALKTLICGSFGTELTFLFVVFTLTLLKSPIVLESLILELFAYMEDLPVSS